MNEDEVSVNIHQAARNLLAMPKLPSLETDWGMPVYGICFALKYHGGCDEAYGAVRDYAGTAIEGPYLPNPGHWTEQRLNLVCLLAMTEPGDWV